MKILLSIFVQPESLIYVSFEHFNELLCQSATALAENLQPEKEIQIPTKYQNKYSDEPLLDC